LVFAITAGLSSATYLAIERPALLIKSKPQKGPALPPAQLSRLGLEPVKRRRDDTGVRAL
jgi:hypothetical protein